MQEHCARTLHHFTVLKAATEGCRSRGYLAQSLVKEGRPWRKKGKAVAVLLDQAERAVLVNKW